MRNFQEIIAWQKSHQLTLEIYVKTRHFPKDEMFVLTSQMRRSSSSIPTNIAEGCGHNSNLQLKYFFTVATASCSELEYQLILSRDLNYINQQTFYELSESVVRIRKMIATFIKKIPL